MIGRSFFCVKRRAGKLKYCVSLDTHKQRIYNITKVALQTIKNKGVKYMKILFAADTVPTKISEPLFINGDVETLFTDVLPLMQNADRMVVNLECALTETDEKIKKFGPNLKAHPACVKTIKKAGITDIMLANNHVFDFGVDGLVDTVETLKKAGLPYAGVGNNDTDSRKIYYIEQDNKKIAIVNVCEHEYTYALPNRMGANPFDPFITMQDVREAKRTADFVVVIYHGGKEHCRYPSPRLRNLCREMVLNGANAVLCQHSHCIGCYEKYENGHIMYGQGNFHFAEPIEGEKWNTGMLIELDFTDKVDIKFYPFELQGASITLAKGETYDSVMSTFEQRNQELLNGKWKDGWVEFCHSVKWYFDALYNVKAEEPNTVERFAHYLDCEAHTDVWRELFTTWNLTNETEEEKSNKKI